MPHRIYRIHIIYTVHTKIFNHVIGCLGVHNLTFKLYNVLSDCWKIIDSKLTIINVEDEQAGTHVTCDSHDCFELSCMIIQMHCGVQTRLEVKVSSAKFFIGTNHLKTKEMKELVAYLEIV